MLPGGAYSLEPGNTTGESQSVSRFSTYEGIGFPVSPQSGIYGGGSHHSNGEAYMRGW